MSLTLNDEQEKALREWYAMDSTNAWKPSDAGKRVKLAVAIAPLMKPWRVEPADRGMLCSGRVVGPNGVHFRVQSDQAELLCRVLNGEERW